MGVTTRVISAFFGNRFSSSLFIKGSALLDFVTEEARKLKERENEDLTVETEQQPFQLEVSLVSRGDRIVASDDKKAAPEDDGMLGIIAIIAGALLALFVGALIYTKKIRK